MDSEVVVHTHNGILLTYKKECIWVCSNEVDEPGGYYTEWSKSEGEKQILYINAHIWNLENGADKPICSAAMEMKTENSLMDKGAREEREVELNGKSSMEAYIAPYVK